MQVQLLDTKVVLQHQILNLIQVFLLLDDQDDILYLPIQKVVD